MIVLTKDDYADFTWMWGQKFFLETKHGNFVWSDPNYQGDNTIRPFQGTLLDFCKTMGVDYGRSKGIHMISRYCGEKVIIMAESCNTLPILPSKIPQ
jgi:hypothetical protein